MSAPEPKAEPSTPPVEDRPERRDTDLPDRRKNPRGGRRATDTVKRLARFAYELLIEPPK